MTDPDSSTYTLLDAGLGTKLEQVGSHRLLRPCPQALWAAARPDAWDDADATFERSATGGGRWVAARPLPESWTIEVDRLRLHIKPTGFGHLGLFPEQIPFWGWIRARTAAAGPDCEVLNLFAYTGGSTLAAAQGGGRVTHCDASRGVVQWASDNARLSGLADAPVRWVVEDVDRFVRREERRERRYQGLVLDPPSFGRGPKGQVFKIERDLPDLLARCARLLADDARFVLLSAHTPLVTPLTLRHLLAQALRDRGGDFAAGEMSVRAAWSALLVPSGTWATWTFDGRETQVAPPGRPS